MNYFSATLRSFGISALVLLILLPSLLSAEPFVNGRIDLEKRHQKFDDEQRANKEASTKDLIFKTNKPLPPMVSKQEFRTGISRCEVQVSSNYSQLAEFVEVETLVENYQCAASNGKYLVHVRTQSDGSEINLNKYEQIWSRKDDEPVRLKHRYSMMGDSDLVSVRIKMPSRDYCSCLE